MGSFASYSFVDQTGEKSRVKIGCDTLTGVNFGAVTGAMADGGALGAAIQALTLCTLEKVDIMASSTNTGHAAPTDMHAQRENGLMVSYRDTVTGKKYRVTIPGPDWTTLGLAGTDQVNPAAAEWTAFVTAFEANARSEFNNPVEVLGGQYVGRNS